MQEKSCPQCRRLACWLANGLKTYVITVHDNSCNNYNTNLSSWNFFVCCWLVFHTQADQTHAVYLRANMSKESALSVWQIMPADEEHCEPLKWGAKCKLLHVLTGHFLCIRAPSGTDCDVVQSEASIAHNRQQWSVALTGPNDPAAIFEV